MNTALTIVSVPAPAAVVWPKSGNWPFVIGAIAAVAFLWWTYQVKPVAARANRESKPWAILYGADGRRSTSKLTAYTWTAALLFGGVTLCAAALLNKLPLGDIGLDTLPEQYLVLLAVPYGSLVAAKLITQSKVENQTLVKAAPAPQGADKQTGPYEEGGFTAGDRGQTSLQDVQYLTFNALLLVYFVTALWSTHALPELPDWLVGLTGASAATFIAAKGVESEQSEIKAITQHKQGDRWVLQVRGKHLHQPIIGAMDGAQFEDVSQSVTVDGHTVDKVVFLGEQGIDVTLLGERKPEETLTVTLLGGVILTDKK